MTYHYSVEVHADDFCKHEATKGLRRLELDEYGEIEIIIFRLRRYTKDEMSIHLKTRGSSTVYQLKQQITQYFMYRAELLISYWLRTECDDMSVPHELITAHILNEIFLPAEQQRISLRNSTIDNEHTLRDYCFYQKCKIQLYQKGMSYSYQNAIIWVRSWLLDPKNGCTLYISLHVDGCTTIRECGQLFAKELIATSEDLRPLVEKYEFHLIFPWRSNTEHHRPLCDYDVWDGCDAGHVLFKRKR